MDWIGDDLWVIYVGLGVLLGIIEITSLELVFLMFAGGAFSAAIASYLGAGLPISIVVFATVSAALTLLVRPPIIARIHDGPQLPSGHHGLVGRLAVVEQTVSRLGGLVEIAGETWTARPANENDEFPAGAELEVVEIRGATAIVDHRSSLESS